MPSGSVTIPEAIDELARSTPEKTWIRYAASSQDLKNKVLIPISFALLANAVNRLAWHLTTHLPRLGDLETTICYLGPSDIRYFIIACAATKCRVRLLLSSPRNNLEAHQSLFEQTQCRILAGPLSCCESLRDACNMEHVGLPELEELLDEKVVDSYPWTRSFAELAHEPFVILHTSGSTGQPKPVEVSHQLVATVDAQQRIPDVDGRCITTKMWKDRSLYAAMPLFHSAAFNVLAFSIFQGTQLVLGPSDQPPSVDTVDQILDGNFAVAGLIPPSLLAEVAAETAVLEKLARWESVAFGGGPLDEEAAKAIWGHTKVLPLLGSTETFNIPELVPQCEDDLQYHDFHPGLGVQFQEVSDNLHELVFVRDAEVAEHQGAFCTFPEVDEYHMKDMYEKHPTKAGLWKYRGRLDDVIVLSNGEKLNPCQAENILATHNDIQSALIVGSGREVPLLLVEPKREMTTELNLSDEIRRANAILPAYGQIYSSHICITKPESFLRSSKGTIRRAPTVDTFQAKIDETYAAAEHDTTNSQLDFSTTETLTSSLSHVITAEILPGQTLEPTANIFDYGVDSQGVLRLTRTIKGSMQAQHLTGADNVSPRVIYNERTPINIAKSLETAGDAGQHRSEDMEEEMLRTLEVYLQELPETTESPDVKPLPSHRVFLLTGSTGSLGSYLLDALLRSQPSAKIICLNRPGSNVTRQKKIQQARGLSDDFSYVEFMEGTIAEEHLGLDQDSYKRLQQATHIVHNAWSVNWNLPLSAFEDQLMACCRLIALANTAVHDVSITFLSSIGAANCWAREGSDDLVPETKLDDFSVAESTGYARSKLLAERLFSAANERLKLTVSICRLGQIAGPVASTHGMWSTQEWFPSILLSAKKMGKMPESLAAMDRMDWIPVDRLADILMDMICGTSSEQSEKCEWLSRGGVLADQEIGLSTPDRNASIGSPSPKASTETSPISTPATSITGNLKEPEDGRSLLRFFHLVNPHSVDWPSLAPSVANLLSNEVKLVSFTDWMEALAAKIEEHDGRESHDLPAAKLIDFLNEIADGATRRSVFSVEKSLLSSKKLQDLPPVCFEWFERWCHQWSEALE